jgi:hypothetical protein
METELKVGDVVCLKINLNEKYQILKATLLLVQELRPVLLYVKSRLIRIMFFQSK